MSNIAIEFENISKQYRLGTIGTGTISHDLNRWWHQVRGKEDPYLKVGEVNDRSTKATSDYVWALKDVSFSVDKGEVLGIIGKNGAGKSTLLKILSRVTSPTTGSIKAKGRIASLLEVGTGFHAEMTGRENVYMNGAIMGMTRREITSKLDEIVAFSGIEKYIDTPVKRYSSGMTVRLGFAVAAHLEPEILVVDEVLAVGDAEFQKKAIGKMKDVSQGGGRTVLFVSHNMGAVKNLCTRGVLMKNGMVETDGQINQVIDYYLNNYIKNVSSRQWDLDKAPGANGVKILSASILNLVGEQSSFSKEDPITLEFLFYKETEEEYQSDITFHLIDEMDNLVFVGSTAFTQDTDERYSGKGHYRTTVTIPENLLNEGSYKISRLLFVKNRGFIMCEINDVLSFEVTPSIISALGWQGGKEGVVSPKLNWVLELDGKQLI
ncbi:MAG: hypothetical protein RL662_2317 [Bacteroidota bacterium]|jgi:lipopolysaccharide transport system ATP-binding protein